jgi:hypothetical protein
MGHFNTELSWKQWSTRLRQATAWHRGQSLVFVFAHFFLFWGGLRLLHDVVTHVETRKGVVLFDPVLAELPVHSVDTPLFVLLYGGMLLCWGSLLRSPLLFLRALSAYGILAFFRSGAMLLLPLEPPPGMITLIDPVVQAARVGGNALTKDLFFSGHTSGLALFFFCAQSRWVKGLLLIGLCGVGVGVLLQRVHYTIDVYCAPFFAYCAFQASGVVQETLMRFLGQTQISTVTSAND